MAQTKLTKRNVAGDTQNAISKSDQDVILKFNSREIEAGDETISRLVSKRTQSTPTRVAVDSWDWSLSFADLDDLSTRLSRHLRDTFGCEQKPIMTVFKKSALAVVVLLAILKSGNHYAPADPSHPRSRIQAMKEHAHPASLTPGRLVGTGEAKGSGAGEQQRSKL